MSLVSGLLHSPHLYLFVFYPCPVEYYESSPYSLFHGASIFPHLFHVPPVCPVSEHSHPICHPSFPVGRSNKATARFVRSPLRLSSLGLLTPRQPRWIFSGSSVEIDLPPQQKFWRKNYTGFSRASCGAELSEMGRLARRIG